MDGGSIEIIAEKLRHAPYAKKFAGLFGENIFQNTKLLMSEALFAVGRYQIEEPSFHPYTSKYDYWLEGKARLGESEMRGYRLFNDPDKANCAGCHTSQPTRDGLPPLFTDFQYEALGAPRNLALADTKDLQYFDLGVCGPIRKDIADQTQFCGMFKTPTLRNTAVRRAFFHNGVFQTLQQVLDFYNFRDTNPEKVYPRRGRRQGPEIQRHSGAVSRQCRCERSALQSPPGRGAGDDGAGRSRHYRISDDVDGWLPAETLKAMVGGGAISSITIPAARVRSAS